jgi:endonuclease/exonuclease/phosphatase family metal-dependent hydrolase
VRFVAPDPLPAASPDPSRVRAVHWNIEHGNWYEQVEAALLGLPGLAGADLYFFNEIDLGMARAGNRDVTGDLAHALGLHGVWAPLLLETTPGRDDDPRMAAGRENEEALFGLAILSRWPIADVRVLELPSPIEVQFDLERMVGRHIALIARIEHPRVPFVAVSTHLEVHRGRAQRARQAQVIVEALRGVREPVVLAGDFNTHTFDRGLWHSPFSGAGALLLTPGPALARRLLHPDRGPHRETLFEHLERGGFEWAPFVDYAPTLELRVERLDEAQAFLRALGPLARPLLDWAELRGRLRLDWFAGRGWAAGSGCTVGGVSGPGKASDHAPIVAEFIGA